MESSCEANGKSIDSTVGALVWVRRRNGSWWPGRILGNDELPESCLVSPRSGTPVKLLGREDASVDWYNLEKSKRIKSFRCGEYDKCIEKAKITASISSKKNVKYARREDAILHALELENSQLSNNFPESTSQIATSAHKQTAEETENLSDKLSGLESISISLPELSRTAASADHSEDDGIEKRKKRMRGLEDLGIGRAVSSFKKRRSRVARVRNYLKKRNRRRQLTKVLNNTAMVSVPVMCEQVTNFNKSFFPDVSDNKMSGIEYNGNSSISELLENMEASGRLFDVPFIGEEKTTAGSSPGLLSVKARLNAGFQYGQNSLFETVSVGPNKIQESISISSAAVACTDDISNNINDDISNNINNDISNKSNPNTTSKWQHKRKRNSRNKKRKSLQKNICKNDKNDIDSLYDVSIEVKAGHFPHHIPYMSLLSKLTGQPITGHTIVVEVLNGSVSDPSFINSCELDMVNEDVRNHPEASGKPRKNGILSNKKIRKLSSLTGSKKPSETEILKKPCLACVPLKIVFGRLNEALGINPTRPVNGTPVKSGS